MSFEVIKQSIPDILLIKPKVFADERGYFKESYNLQDFETFLPGVNFVQDNESKSDRGVIRGLHFQRAPHAQAKLIRVIQGSIWDVAVDIRAESPTFKQYCFAELTADNHMQFFVPRGFAHAFLVTSETAIVQYKTDNFYEAAADGGIHPHDPDLNIPWPFRKNQHILSSKDQVQPTLSVFIERSN
ncbi:MAG: dTDP-4-dehydrorhamnose 3,5-epimerase [Bacteroidetes bacterium]|jgi:dTDP-4-dehydrorhamnose 3,5-epimerase|nr:dTDP-4-dehydrorhamnose 3,5-epimerase [Bacteroidota bacterium]